MAAAPVRAPPIGGRPRSRHPRPQGSPWTGTCQCCSRRLLLLGPSTALPDGPDLPAADAGARRTTARYLDVKIYPTRVAAHLTGRTWQRTRRDGSSGRGRTPAARSTDSPAAPGRRRPLPVRPGRTGKGRRLPGAAGLLVDRAAGVRPLPDDPSRGVRGHVRPVRCAATRVG